MTSGAPQEKPAKVAKRAAAGPGAARGAGAAGAPQLVDDADLPPRAPMVCCLTQPAPTAQAGPPCTAQTLQGLASAVRRMQPQASRESRARLPAGSADRSGHRAGRRGAARAPQQHAGPARARPRRCPAVMGSTCALHFRSAC